MCGTRPALEYVEIQPTGRGCTTCGGEGGREGEGGTVSARVEAGPLDHRPGPRTPAGALPRRRGRCVRRGAVIAWSPGPARTDGHLLGGVVAQAAGRLRRVAVAHPLAAAGVPLCPEAEDRIPRRRRPEAVGGVGPRGVLPGGQVRHGRGGAARPRRRGCAEAIGRPQCWAPAHLDGAQHVVDRAQPREAPLPDAAAAAAGGGVLGWPAAHALL
jgi:hypothetical protein